MYIQNEAVNQKRKKKTEKQYEEKSKFLPFYIKIHHQIALSPAML